MTDPFVIENDFLKLKQLLTLTTSRRLKLLHILNFIEPLLEEKKQSFLAAYIDELFPHFILITQVDRL
jgi:hypothetical protein